MKPIYENACNIPSKLLHLGAFLLIYTVAVTAYAGNVSSGWVYSESNSNATLKLSLIDSKQRVNDTIVTALLEINLQPPWKTYWKFPGQGGIAPSLDWKKSSNLASVDWLWPTPKRYEVAGVETLGYKDYVAFPIQLHINDPRKVTHLAFDISLPTCTDICVLSDFTIDMNFIANDLKPSAEEKWLYTEALRKVPTSSSLLKINQSKWYPENNILKISLTNKNQWNNPDIFIVPLDEKDREFSFKKPEIQINQNMLSATFLVTSWLDKPDISGSNLSIVVNDNKGAVNEELTTIATKALSSLSENNQIKSTWLTDWLKILITALIGGLILNVMPCVLPVLGMKLGSIITAQSLKKRQIRLQFLTSASGILVSFWLLSGFMILLKLSGHALGWGIQFQTPYFIGFMFLVTALFAVNMLGLLFINLPSGMATWMSQKGNVTTYSGHFFQGMFATLLATPCSAPFLGTAVAFALASPPLTLFGMFTALGLGMAMPWLIIATFPKLATKLPKPGRWMVHVKLFFGLLIFATSLWLLSLMSSFIDNRSIAVLLIMYLSFILWRIWRVKGKETFRTFFYGFIAVSVVGFTVGYLTINSWQSKIVGTLNWQPLNQVHIQSYVKDNKTVFVEVTADWCVTCQANKFTVLLQEPVYSLLNSDDVILMKGDWTKPSDKIANYLKRNNRFGIPFYAVYNTKHPEGLKLPVLLTESLVIDAIEQAE